MKFLVAIIVVMAVAAQAQFSMMRKIDSIPGAPVYPKPTIVGGTQAYRGQFPHQAAIIMDTTSFCGGSLISTRWIMTACHCVSGFIRYDVTLGAQNRINPEPGSVTISAFIAICNGAYGQKPYLTNDIGLIELIRTIEETEFIKVVNLPTRTEAALSFAGEPVLASGWGRLYDGATALSQQLIFAELRVITEAECKANYGGYIVAELAMCCLGRDSNEGTCNGDSGGALILDNGAVPPTQVGIVTFGNAAGCESGAPSGYERTGPHLDWISEKTGIPIIP